MCKNYVYDVTTALFLLGYYCPNGTIADDQYPCPPGSYSGRIDLTSADECDMCPQGYYCSWGTGNFSSANPPRPCEQGHYCPFQTPSPDRFPCPAGTYSDRSDLWSADQCTPCPAGEYCLGTYEHLSGHEHMSRYCTYEHIFRYVRSHF